MGPYGTSTDPYPEVGSSPYPKKTTWTSQSSRYGRTPRSIPYRRTYVGARHAGRMRTTRPITTSRFTSQMMSRGLVNMVSSPTARTRRRARPVGRALTSSVSYCDSSGFPDRPVMTAGTTADARVPGVDRRGIPGWCSAAPRPPTPGASTARGEARRRSARIGRRWHRAAAPVGGCPPCVHGAPPRSSTALKVLRRWVSSAEVL